MNKAEALRLRHHIELLTEQVKAAEFVINEHRTSLVKASLRLVDMPVSGEINERYHFSDDRPCLNESNLLGTCIYASSGHMRNNKATVMAGSYCLFCAKQR